MAKNFLKDFKNKFCRVEHTYRHTHTQFYIYRLIYRYSRMSYDLVNIFKDIDILQLKLYKHIIAIGCLSLNLDITRFDCYKVV